MAAPSTMRSHRPAGLLWVVALVLIAVLVHAGVGTIRILPLDVLREILAGPSDTGSTAHNVIWSIRLPQTCACLLVGAMLGAVGSAFQALFRNPLAEPYTVGVSSGAAVGGVIAQVLGIGFAMGGLATPLAAFMTGLLSLMLVFALARRRGSVDVTTLLLAGVVVGSLLSAVLSFVLLGAGKDTNQLFRWLMGSTSPMFWNRVGVLLAVCVLGTIVLIRQTRRLNAFAIGEETAQRLGVNTRALKNTVLVTGTAMTATAVGSVGIVPFIGLVAPHIARRVFGVDWRLSLPASLLIGSLLMIVSDLVAQLAIKDQQIPVGIVAALLGAPSLLVLLRKAG